MNPIADTKASEYSSNTMTEHQTALERFIDKDTLALFNVNAEHENWPGPIADISLFNIWKRMQAQGNASDSLIVSVQEDSIFAGLELPCEIDLPVTDASVQLFPDITPVTPTITPTSPLLESLQNISPTISNLASPVSKKELSNPEEAIPSTSSIASSTPKSSKANIPSPFKRALFWPEEKKHRKKDKIPSVVTSDIWQEYHRKKTNEKKRKQEELDERKKQREMKQQRKMEEMQKKATKKNNKSSQY
ncbi:hypothetical protein ANN_28010 [Periplaneta americana]|uniref:Uncharacterized protein n=1 Tax=Periplaneta americana TaxID=6978 RepID=A0ABQ8RUP2_PERAM|nr:hypothetical protein ANN_28010 [Periplaneta americana]